MSFLYFAYGSNMLPARLVARCPSARVVGRAAARDHDLDFSKPGDDGSGKATLFAHAGRTTPGVLYEIADADLSSLDRAEGAGKGYVREVEFRIACENDAESEATTYIADIRDQGLLPWDWYLALVVAGARMNGLPDTHCRALAGERYAIDAVPDRSARRIALEALEAHDFGDYTGLIGRDRQ